MSMRDRLTAATLALFMTCGSLQAFAQNIWEPFPLPPVLEAPENRALIPLPPGPSPEAVLAPQPAPNLQFTWAAIPNPLGLLPPPANPNLLFSETLAEAPGIVAQARAIPVELQTNAVFRVDTAYDTGFVGSGLSLLPSTVALADTAEARRGGRFHLSPTQSQLTFAILGTNRNFRADTQIEFLEDADIRHIKAQAALPSSDLLYAGSTWTTFMDEFAVPISLNPDSTSAGVVFRRQPQLGYYRPIDECSGLSTAIELGPSDDYTLVATDDERLRRYPDWIVRWRWSDSRDPRFGSSLHVATLVRALGRENTAFEEDFALGWGISTMLKLAASERDHLFAGFVGGEGIGSYLFGFLPREAAPADNMPAGGPEGGELIALPNYGTHFGYRRVWSPDRLQSNVGFGYAFAEATADMPPNAARHLTNAWINHQWQVSAAISVGLEYHYAIRDVQSGREGDNHRVTLGTQFLK